MSLGYLNTPINKEYQIQVDQTHQLYVEESGNPAGQPVVFLHGGPGGSISEMSRRFFDPAKFRIIAFDQRGTGKSQPFLSLENNTPFHSVQDMEVIREHLNIDDWIVFGGSYGSTLALLYAIHHPERVQHLVLRGIFLGRKEDVDWLFEGGTGYFYPEEFERFKNFLPENERHQIVLNYYKKMTSKDQKAAKQAMKSWADWESGLVTLFPKFNTDPEITESDQSLGLLEAHYFAHQMFWEDDNYIINHAHQLKDIPTDIVHGRYDVDCRPSGAYDLKQAIPHAALHLVELGAHSPYEEVMMETILTIMDRF